MCNWKDLPDWTKAEAYSFLNQADNVVWAWELLRRNKDYRDDWNGREGQIGKHVYHPPMRGGESEQQWMRRVVFTTQFDPVKTCKAFFTARRWGLNQLQNPSEPFSTAIQFSTADETCPILITHPDQINVLVESVEMDEFELLKVVDDRAVIAVDMTRPLTEQLQSVDKKLRILQQRRIQTGHIRLTRSIGQKRTWLRHLRTLDGLRCAATYKDIGIHLGGKQCEDADPDKLRKIGERFVAAARKFQNAGCRPILMYKGTPTT